MEKELKQSYEDILNGKSLRHYWKPTLRSGLCPPHNFIKKDAQWAQCTYCGQMTPIYIMKLNR